MTAASTTVLDARPLAATLSRLARELAVPGAQLVLCRAGELDAPVTAQVGEVEHGSGRPVDADQAFPVGSITKYCTATTLMALVADGDVELDEPVGLHLRGLGTLGADITVRQALSHTSGLANGPGSEEVTDLSAQRYLVEHCHPGNVVQRPGVAFSYSNMGYVMAGALIESITGMRWAEAVDSILLRPLGITAALVGAQAGTPARPVATGHSVNRTLGRIRPVRQSLAESEYAAGGLALSARDLARLGTLHVGDGVSAVLPPAYAAQMRTVAPGAGAVGIADGWGLGLAIFDGAHGAWVGHDGNAEGTACYLRVDPIDGWIVALTCNAGTGYELWHAVLTELAAAGVPVPLPRAPEPVRAARPPRECVGAYANGDLDYLVTADPRGGLWLSLDGDEAEELAVADDLTFVVRDAASGVWTPGGRFVRDPATGAVAGIQMSGRLGARREYAVLA